MVLTTAEQGEGSQVRENGVAGGAGFCQIVFRNKKLAMDTPVMSVTEVDGDGDEVEVSEEDDLGKAELDYTRNYWEDEDDIYQEFEELDFEALPDHSDTHSIASDDSFYPPDSSVISDLYRSPSPESISFFKACCNNNAIIVKILIRQGVTEEEVRETDRNRRSGLIVACYHGYVDVVLALSQCPYLDVNWQDNEGNTALITAAQAGHVFILNYLLSYFPGLDVDRRNCHCFTALMKAAMQGRAECVRALMLAGGDIQARDNGRSLTPREWALFTGRYETANMMHRLMVKPCAEQFCDSFSLEWPMLEVLHQQQGEPNGRWRPRPHGPDHHVHLQPVHCHGLPNSVPRQPALRREAAPRRAGDSEEATHCPAEAHGPRQTEQLQEIFPELAGPPHPQGDGAAGQPPAPAAHGRGHRGLQASQSPAAPHAEEEQRAAGCHGAQSEALQSPGSELFTRKAQAEQ
ncbi:ankyrin repeat domain-containing protein 33B-like isoform X2 [Scophthalmus maximus]|uniref:ankyrin repeat domain-containing protein 33B-like isoform X2 n=1 Tax=Scophthalmus maximus TaxID=52904 RepID=UPI0015E0C92C|nr:ankyrin repeat domain-containing protein 33B-like isoform X2 [Scophthalmus maximus]